MKPISLFGEDVTVTTNPIPAHRWNEAELLKTTIQYKVGEITKTKDVLLRECILWNKAVHNTEIRDIYNQLREINDAYQWLGMRHHLNVVKHFTDEEGNIYIKDLNPTGDIYVHDLLPDAHYFSEEYKEKSRFKDFKKTVNDFNLNRVEIISSMFEQLAILHANGFVVGNLKQGDKEMRHPTLSLFLCRLKNKKGDLAVKIFLHDIHNLVPISQTEGRGYCFRCVHDLKDMAFDIIQFFRGIGIPQGWFAVYGKVLKDLNPELYSEIFRTFLWNPEIEIETRAMKNIAFWGTPMQAAGRKVISKIKKDSEKKEGEWKDIFQNDNIFFFASRKKTILQFLESTDPDNTECIFDFDGTLTSPDSKNAFHAGNASPSEFKIYQDSLDGFHFRRGALAFLRLLRASGFDVKIHSLGFKEIISETLSSNEVSIQPDSIFANRFDRPVFSKSEIPITLNPKKRQIIFADNPQDFDIPSVNGALKIGFLTSKNALRMNAATDFYYTDSREGYLTLYRTFQQFFKK